MDFTINLPTDECTCDAKVFYDKYRKQVDIFIQNEIAKTSSIVVGKKAAKEHKSTSTSALTKKLSKTKRQYKKKKILLLPKIEGIRFKISEDEEDRESESVSVSTFITESLPRIKVDKKWSQDLYLSSSSLESPILRPSSISSFDMKKSELAKKIKIDEPKILAKNQKIDVQWKKDTKPLSKKHIHYKGKHIDQGKQIVDHGKQVVDHDKQVIDHGKQVVDHDKQVVDHGKQVVDHDKQVVDHGKQVVDHDKQVVDHGKQVVDLGKQVVGMKISDEDEQIEDTIALRKKQLTKAWLKKQSSTEDEDSTVSSWEIKPKKVESRAWKKKPVPVKDRQVQTKLRKSSGERKTLSSSSSSSSSLISSSPDEYVDEKKIMHKQPVRKEIIKKIYSKTLLKKKKSSETVTPEDEISLASYDYTNGLEVIKLTKINKEEDFKALLISKSKKEGLDENFISDLLTKARESGKEEDLLRSLSSANEEGKLSALLIDLSETMQSGIFNEVTDTLIKEDKDKKRKTFVLELIKAFKGDKKDENYLNNLISEAKKENPDDELFLILSKSADENKLKTVLNNLNQAQRQGQLDDMVTVLIKKGKREQTNQLMSAISIIAEDNGQDDTFIENLLSKAKETGKKDELLLKLQRAKTKGNLDKVIATLANATDEELLENLLNSKIEIEEPKRREKHLKASFDDDDSFDDDFLNEWFSKAKDKEKEKLLMDKWALIKKSGKSVDFSNITRIMNIEDLDDLNSIMNEILSDVDSEIDILPSVLKGKRQYQQKQLLRRKKQWKKQRKFSKEMKQRKASADLKSFKSSRGSAVSGRYNLRRSQIDKIKERLLFKRQYSFGTLPDVNYELIRRQTLSATQLIESEKIEEEEHVYEEKIEAKESKMYRESFLKKIYGGRKIGPTPAPDYSSVSSSSASAYAIRKRRPPRKKPKTKKAPDTEKGSPSQILQPPRKLKKHIIRYAKKKDPLGTEKEFTDSDISSFEQLLDKKISNICEIGGEDRSDRGYLVGFRYKDDEETFDWRNKPKKDSILSESNFSDDWMSRTRRRAILYCNTRKLEEFFHFLGSHLVSDEPGDPIEYLIVLLQNCIHYRNGVGRPPLLFEHYHVESLYYSMDIFNEGSISLEQYRTGMETLFIRDYKEKPRTNQKNMVLKNTFIYEALKGQRIQIKDMLRGPAESIFPPKRKSSATTLGSIWSKIELYHDG